MFGAKDEPAELRRCDIARFDPDALAALLRLRDAARARGRDARRGLVGAAARGAEPLLQRGRPGHPRPRSTSTATRRTRTSSRRSAHAHIDTAWLWPLAETYRKMQRSFSSQLPLHGGLPRVPLRLLAGAAVRVDQGARSRALGADPRGAVERGQFVPVGGSWVEPDCNLPSGESLVAPVPARPALVRARVRAAPPRVLEPGRLRLRRAAAADPARGRHHALPHAEALVEPLQPPRAPHARCGRATTAARCSRTIRRPTPTTARSAVPELLKVTRDYRDHDHSRTSLLVYGYGDGGGGPTSDMLETLRRAADLQGLPRTTPRTSEEFFDALEAEEAAAAGRRRRALLRVPPRRLHVAGAHEARQPALRAGPARRRVPRLPRRRVSARRARPALEAAAAAAVPRHPARARRSGSCTRTPSATSPRSRRARTRSCRPARRSRTPSASRGARSWAILAGRGGAVRRGARRRARRRGARRRSDARERAPARDALARRLASSRCCTRRAAARRSPRRATGSSSTTTARSPSTPGTSTPRRSRRGATSRPRRRGARARRRCAPRSRSSGRGLTQVVRLDAGSRRVEFHTTIDWHEEHTLLKVCFPLAVHARNATYEMPFGTPSARRTGRRAGIARATRCRATAGPTSPSTASASRS